MMAGRLLKSNAPKTALPVDVIINRVLDAIVACGAMGDLERSTVGGRSRKDRRFGAVFRAAQRIQNETHIIINNLQT